ncbi:thiol-disulfide oxidoreductase DCC family protein [Bacillus sp. RG28]|uniref:Thiol-disulfide oxidoreductase DCC family protein n=1 Tax=Gottfriedia endophytica TaxID=2820819 RepID=A0A940NT28_9BACI|nr:thiol-disulfide oxidoreductase DCC family protein [Gottfriedia endophytica]MBP0724363.1 thiol-disulfide oxidoreductase DCC family protein [Gottfriedia endophytica]
MKESRKIILFDGVCQFCNGSVNFIIKQDVKQKFLFAPLQSEFGSQFLQNHPELNNVDSLVLLENEHYFIYSTAALKIVKQLKWKWKFLYAFILVPKPIRDFVYKLVAKNRYRLFGKIDTCMVPTKEIKKRFLI